MLRNIKFVVAEAHAPGREETQQHVHTGWFPAFVLVFCLLFVVALLEVNTGMEPENLIVAPSKTWDLLDTLQVQRSHRS